MMRAHQPGSQPIDVPETIPNPAIPRTVPHPEPRPSEPVKVPVTQPHVCGSSCPELEQCSSQAIVMSLMASRLAEMARAAKTSQNDPLSHLLVA
jgi:hypothetical protein